MALITVVSVKDLAMQGFGRPIFVPSRGVALRSFMDEVRKDGSDMAAHPEDFELYSVGFFDDESGLFINNESGAPELMLRAVNVGLQSKE